MCNANQPGIDDKELIDRLGRLEARITNLDDLRRRIKLVTWCGSLVIIAAFAVFIYRLGSQVQYYVDTLKNPEQSTQLVKQFIEDAQAERIVQDELKLFVQDFEKQVVPELQKAVEKEMVVLVDNAKVEGQKSLDRLQKHVQLQIETKIGEAMLSSARHLEAELKQNFPELKDKDISGLFEANKATFIIEMDKKLTAQLKTFEKPLELVDKTLTQFSKEAEGLDMDQETAEALLVDSLFELAAYELKPEIGAEPLPPGAGKLVLPAKKTPVAPKTQPAPAAK
jgi:hypothetical protein